VEIIVDYQYKTMIRPLWSCCDKVITQMWFITSVNIVIGIKYITSSAGFRHIPNTFRFLHFK